MILILPLMYMQGGTVMKTLLKDIEELVMTRR